MLESLEPDYYTYYFLTFILSELIVRYRINEPPRDPKIKCKTSRYILFDQGNIRRIQDYLYVSPNDGLTVPILLSVYAICPTLQYVSCPIFRKFFFAIKNFQ